MDDLEQRIALLQRFAPLAEANVQTFLEEVASVTSSGDRRVVRPILLLADERCALGGVMDRMLSLLEDVPVREYVEELLEALPEFLARSPLHAEQEVKKLLWSERDRSVLIAAVRQITSDRASALLTILDKVDSADLAQAVTEIRTALKEHR